MKRIIHKFIVWYLRNCGHAFHHGEYGDKGRYVVLMNESQYHKFNWNDTTNLKSIQSNRN
jgi:hypothetical protein